MKSIDISKEALEIIKEYRAKLSEAENQLQKLKGGKMKPYWVITNKKLNWKTEILFLSQDLYWSVDFAIANIFQSRKDARDFLKFKNHIIPFPHDAKVTKVEVMLDWK